MSDRKPPPVVAALRRVEGVLNAVLARLTVGLLLLSALLAGLGVALRYFAGISYDVMEELCRVAIVYASLLYLGPMITRNAHLNMSFVTDMLSDRVNRYFDLLLYIAITALLVWAANIAWKWDMSLKMIGMTTMSGVIPAWLPGGALPAGLAVAVFYSGLRVVYRLAGVDIHTAGAAE